MLNCAESLFCSHLASFSGGENFFWTQSACNSERLEICLLCSDLCKQGRQTSALNEWKNIIKILSSSYNILLNYECCLQYKPWAAAILQGKEGNHNLQQLQLFFCLLEEETRPNKMGLDNFAQNDNCSHSCGWWMAWESIINIGAIFPTRASKIERGLLFLNFLLLLLFSSCRA